VYFGDCVLSAIRWLQLAGVHFIVLSIAGISCVCGREALLLLMLVHGYKHKCIYVAIKLYKECIMAFNCIAMFFAIYCKLLTTMTETYIYYSLRQFNTDILVEQYFIVGYSGV
jgi:hypothetical protein